MSAEEIRIKIETRWSDATFEPQQWRGKDGYPEWSTDVSKTWKRIDRELERLALKLVGGEASEEDGLRDLTEKVWNMIESELKTWATAVMERDEARHQEYMAQNAHLFDRAEAVAL